MIVDSHCHLDYSELYDQLDRVVKRAEINQVKYMLTICTTLDSYKKIETIINKYDNVYGTFGIHPHESKNFLEVDENYSVSMANDNFIWMSMYQIKQCLQQDTWVANSIRSIISHL